MRTITPSDAPPATPDGIESAQAHDAGGEPASPQPWISELPSELVEAVKGFQREWTHKDFGVIYHYYARRLHAYFRGKRIPRANAADLTQEVWMRVAKGLGRYRWEAPLGAWIFAIARNTWLEHLQRDRSSTGDAPLDPDALPGNDDLLRRLIDDDTRARILEAIDAMPAQMRACMQLRYLQDLSYKEIAELMQLAIETVAAHIHQGKDRLIRLLRPA